MQMQRRPAEICVMYRKSEFIFGGKLIETRINTTVRAQILSLQKPPKTMAVMNSNIKYYVVWSKLCMRSD